MGCKGDELVVVSYGLECNGAVWFALIEVAVVGGLVLYEAGVAAIPGVVLIFLTQPLQVRHIIFSQHICMVKLMVSFYSSSRKCC